MPITTVKIPKMIVEITPPNPITTVSHCASVIPSHPLSKGDEPTALEAYSVVHVVFYHRAIAGGTVVLLFNVKNHFGGMIE
jgi:hypothetical protein